MIELRCPRCRREVQSRSAFCAGCGAPLLLGDEGTAPPLDAPLELDRRVRGARDPGATFPGIVPPSLPGPAAEAPAPGPAGDLAPGPVERSHWDLGSMVAAAARSEPVPAPPPAAGDRDDLELPDADVDALEVHVERAETWRRVVAWVVDGVPFLGAGGALAFTVLREAAAARPTPIRGPEDVLDLLSGERVIALSVAAAVALALATYAALAHALGGATLGKRLVRIRVIGPDGAAPSPARSAVRALVSLVSAGLLGLGFLLALFTRTGRALHDLVARTWVVKAP